jgi:hypothetical protein
MFLTKKETPMTTDPPVDSSVQIELSDADHDCLTVLVNTILDARADQRITRLDAMSALAHVITAAAIGNERELRGWLEPPTVSTWIRACSRNHLCPQCGKNPCVLVQHFGVNL